MKRGTPDHPKLLELADALGARDRRIVVATVELLIHFTREYAIQGDVGRWSDARIASACLWPGEPGTLIDALLRTRWLDLDSRHRLVLHDWHDHADDSTKKVLKNRGLDFIRADGLPQSVPPAGMVPNDSVLLDGIGLPRARAGQVRSGQVQPGLARSAAAADGGSANGSGKTRGRQPKVPMPKGFALTPEREAVLRDGGCRKPTLGFEAMVAYHRREGSIFSDWDQAVRTWALNHERFGCPCQGRETKNGKAPEPHYPDLSAQIAADRERDRRQQEKAKASG